MPTCVSTASTSATSWTRAWAKPLGLTALTSGAKKSGSSPRSTTTTSSPPSRATPTSYGLSVSVTARTICGSNTVESATPAPSRISTIEVEHYICLWHSNQMRLLRFAGELDKEKLTSRTRVVLDMTTLTIRRALPREVIHMVYNMLHEDPGNIIYLVVDGLSDWELRESIELPLMNHELFLRVGIKPPKFQGALLYGPPGTGKTLLARAIASNIDANFLKVVSASAIIDKYIGENAKLMREMFGYARDHQSCIIFMDEIDAIGGRRFNEGTSADREIQRTLMELLNQLNGFDQLRKHGEIDYEVVVKLASGMAAIRAERDYVVHEDFMKTKMMSPDYFMNNYEKN
ncbi:26S proteasome regulatory subunit S10B-like B [Glycine soja]|uniref:26S proteasome regulatory subunit S10B-like B n=1 Tax=Glycine soja TaxID=3848 RepID=A0A445FUQ1_GLYSO|nr:26S proteasome regulatory subunit S10B-like B [Glycine soja]